MSEVHQQLKEKITELETIKKVRKHTLELKARLKEEEKDLEVMAIALDKEQKDVELLEKEGLTTMLHKFLGNREEKLDKEREEYLKASLRYNEIYKSVALIRYELDLLSKKEQTQENVEGEIAVLLKQREEELMQYDPEVALQLKGINDQADKLHKYSVEVEEALSAGKVAFDFVRRAEYHLQQAQNLGQLDMWRHRYYGSGQFKLQSIDQAREAAYQSKHALIKFGNELRDVSGNLQLHVNMEIEDFGQFMNVFFQNVINDWLLQQKINKSL